MGVCTNCVDKYGDWFYFVFRLLIGLLFFMHGYGKLFGGEATGLIWWAGLIELLVGLGVFFGFFTRLAAFGGAIVMLVGYFMMHFPMGWNPLLNEGQAAVLFFAAFLVLMQRGAGKWALERALLKKEVF